MKIIKGLAEAIMSLAPNTTWTFENDDYSTLVWGNDVTSPPTESDLVSEIDRLANLKKFEEENAAKQLAVLQAARESAIEKLASWGLTPDEITALTIPLSS